MSNADVLDLSIEEGMDSVNCKAVKVKKPRQSGYGGDVSNTIINIVQFCHFLTHRSSVPVRAGTPNFSGTT